ncbi:outer membrane beta-barrel protein [Steroidobacter sp. S1-65]|uniref:Outer membrane beta-barrel protein n=1 Tax=Steroidobacter gossypii TaxID=2805490 RepID=A0ABS1X2J0_9GAMM|nr:outer membrane beta-barrel protein [Steroidobacter gossypii]MBM0107449.1 outer membrane beta-barrel protein [Steroidobacter gossypii]
MNPKRVSVATAMIALAGMMPVAQAAQPGFYIGAHYGQADKQMDIGPFNTYAATVVYPNPVVQLTVESMTATLDTKDSGYGFFAGYRFNTHFAVEGGYVDLGNVTYRANLTGNIVGIPTTAVTNVDTESAGITVSALGVWPLSYRWEVYGRAGALFSSNDFRLFYDDIEQNPRRDAFSENDVDLLAGVGTSFSFFEIYDVRLEYQRVFDSGDKTTGEADNDIISLGITVVF